MPVDTAGPLAGKTVTEISAGNGYTCAVADGKAYCWGWNGHGQLGNNSTTDSTVPVPVKADTGPLAGRTVTGITAGQFHSCAVAEGRATCWGLNVFGQLGNNSTTSASVPVAVNTAGPLAGRTVTAVTAGAWHSCVVAEGRASCWGYNYHGQLGNNSTTDSSVPVAVDTDMVLAGKTVTAITAGEFHSCAVAEGRASCWGYNYYGQLGNNSTTDASVPVAVNTAGPLAGRTVTAITASGSHTAALAAAMPQPPTGVAGVPGDVQVSVSWTPPGDDGGSPVLEYVATAIPGGSTCTTAGTSCVVSGLANGTAYTFTVTARNAVGVSAPSAPSVPVTPAAARPGKVTGVKAVVRKGRVKITWKPAPAATSYRVRISKPGGKKYKAWKTTSKRVFKAKVRRARSTASRSLAVGAGPWRDGDDDPVQGQVRPMPGFAGISCRTAHPAPPRDAHRHPVNTGEDARRTETGAAEPEHKSDQAEMRVRAAGKADAQRGLASYPGMGEVAPLRSLSGVPITDDLSNSWAIHMEARRTGYHGRVPLSNDHTAGIHPVRGTVAARAAGTIRCHRHRFEVPAGGGGRGHRRLEPVCELGHGESAAAMSGNARAARLRRRLGPVGQLTTFRRDIGWFRDVKPIREPPVRPAGSASDPDTLRVSLTDSVFHRSRSVRGTNTVRGHVIGPS